MILLAILGALCAWELLRWDFLIFVNEYTPGADARRLRRLRKLQAATTQAIERELTRLQRQEEDDAEGQSTMSQPVPSQPSGSVAVRAESSRPHDSFQSSSLSSRREEPSETPILRNRGAANTKSESTILYSYSILSTVVATIQVRR